MDVNAVDIAVRLEGVTKRFGAHAVYQSLDLALQRGETLSVLGPSGVGKSVMLKLIIGLHQADAGRVIVDDNDITRLGEDDPKMRDVRRRVGMLFQGSALFDSLT